MQLKHGEVYNVELTGSTKKEIDMWIEKLSRQAGVVVAAWGAKGGHLGRDSEVCKMIREMQCLKKTKDGFPGHPLYIPSETELKPFWK